MVRRVEKSDDQWKAELEPDQYQVLRQAGTERAFTGAYYDTKTPGIYRCAGCDTPLFRSTKKYDSGTGWPSFTEPIAPDVVREIADDSLGMRRTEVVCAACGGHLGHVFPDGPAPTGNRYCMNSVSLRLDDAMDPDAPVDQG